jgi:hypothetical protein
VEALWLGGGGASAAFGRQQQRTTTGSEAVSDAMANSPSLLPPLLLTSLFSIRNLIELAAADLRGEWGLRQLDPRG